MLTVQIARQHSHVVMTMTSFGTNIVTLLLPLCVALLAPDNLPEQVRMELSLTHRGSSHSHPYFQWSLIFYLIAGLMFACTIFFDFTARAEPRAWAKPTPPVNKVFAANVFPTITIMESSN